MGVQEDILQPVIEPSFPSSILVPKSHHSLPEDPHARPCRLNCRDGEHSLTTLLERLTSLQSS